MTDNSEQTINNKNEITKTEITKAEIIKDEIINDKSQNDMPDGSSGSSGNSGDLINTNILNSNVLRASATSSLKSKSHLSTDHNIIGKIGYSFILSNIMLGHGSFGDIFLASDENNNKVAIKCCEIDKNGVPNILEASIMGTYMHPHLNRALRIQATDKKLYIIQEIAKVDLSKHTRRNRDNFKPALPLLISWCYNIAQAIAVLHADQIVHADIKASNILLYGEDDVRVSDFSLSVKKWLPDEKFSHSACTCTHRPLECLLRKPWNESLDIWSLACTFYEIAYGELLFPYQGLLETEDKEKSKQFKMRLRKRSINAIVDWAARAQKSEQSKPQKFTGALNEAMLDIDYIPYVFCDDFHKPEMKTFNNLLLSMLAVEPTARPTIQHVLAHEIFVGLKLKPYMLTARPLNNIGMAEYARVTRYIQRHSASFAQEPRAEIVQNLALNLYKKCNDISNTNENIRAAVCVWIASKIIAGYTPNIDFPINHILATERDICHNLLFRLHTVK